MGISTSLVPRELVLRLLFKVFHGLVQDVWIGLPGSAAFESLVQRLRKDAVEENACLNREHLLSSSSIGSSFKMV